MEFTVWWWGTHTGKTLGFFWPGEPQKWGWQSVSAEESSRRGRTRREAPRLYPVCTSDWCLNYMWETDSEQLSQWPKFWTQTRLATKRCRNINSCKKTDRVLSLGGWKTAHFSSLRSFSLRPVAVPGIHSRDGTYGEERGLPGLKNQKKEAENPWTLKIVELSQKRKNQRRGSVKSVYLYTWTKHWTTHL